ncbi:DUF4388 domain-containing protein [Candidatus Obscuribacterales bacterium]|nr:DUF4388 domain-containing protein [Candidatus Obscuribacterales bacterium]
MIEGNLEDISLPGLLQLLAAESTKNYRLRINKGGQHGDVFVCEGHLLVATFGLLEGLDALCEFLNWTDGEFVVEKLPSHFKSTIRSNINLNLSEPGCFSDQCAFLRESNVGLNTEVVPSRTFGTAEWQEALHVQPLEKEDYAILGWITDGRTMRQAMREFQFDLKKTIGVLYRLLITRSVEVVRPTAFSEPVDTDLVKLASKELAKHAEPAAKGVTVEFHATDIGGARARPRGADDTASGLRALNPAASDNTKSSQSTAEPASSTKSEAQDKPVAKDSSKVVKDSDKNSAKPAGKDGEKTAPKDREKGGQEENKAVSRDVEKTVSAEDEKNSSGKDGEKVSVKGDEKGSSKADKTAGWHNVSVARRDGDKTTAKDGEKSSKDAEKPAAKSAAKTEAEPAVSLDTLKTTGPLKAIDPKTAVESDDERQKVGVAAKGDAEPVSKTDTGVAAQNSVPKRKIIDLLRDPIAPNDDESPKQRKEANLSESIAAEDADVADNFKKQLKKASSSGVAEKEHKNGDKKPHQTQDLPAVETNPNDTLNEPLADHLDEVAAKALADFQADISEFEEVLHVVAPEIPVKQFDERRTDPLPLVSIDIERLLVSTFQITNIGSIALTNSQLDELLKQVLLDAERGKTLLLVLTDSNRSESAVLASYRYCLDRGYIEHTDPVMSLTVDLLLGRLELEQYLLQRRRITGDQLRDMVAISNRQGISLDKLLVAAGYMLPIDMERVNKERERFRAR